MTDLKLPVLFTTADEASNGQQRFYLSLIRYEYGLLIAAAVMTMLNFKNPLFFGVYACVFGASLLLLAWRAHAKPEQGWYKSRALAESIKTLSWRYSMRSEPFDDVIQSDAKKDFRDSLAALLRSNRQIGVHLAGLDASGPQITDAMNAIRNSSLKARKEYYLEHRVEDQKRWYTNKSKDNRNSAKRWQIAGAICYIASIILIIVNMRFAELTLPFEPLIVMASAILGWIQIKKFNELASTYALTAHEIGLAAIVISDAKSEQQFSNAVNEVELVFSREHTQWIARQAIGG